MKYEVIVSQNNQCILSWRFKSINTVLQFCREIDLSLVDVDLIRLPDFKRFDVNSLLEAFYGGLNE